MCGITGIISKEKFSNDTYNKISNATTHRGPDNTNNLLLANEVLGNVWLSHNRLSIIDLSPLSNQPMSSSCKTCRNGDLDKNKKYWLTYNGEIYNFKELRSSLEKKGHSFTTNSDSEVLLHLYCEYGVKMLSLLNGIFAFAIYDPYGNKTVPPNSIFIARDQFGVKPIYYTQSNNLFAFSSEMKSILLIPGIQKSLNHEAINCYLNYLWSPSPNTMLSNINKLEPGSFAIYNSSGLHLDSYYKIGNFNPNKNSLKTNIDLTREHLKKAVSRQLVSDVEVGAFLSGGLDSSSIVAIAKQISPSSKIPCFTIKEKGCSALKNEGFSSDLHYARLISKKINVPLSEVEIDDSYISLLPKMIYHLDEPQADPAAINSYLITKIARDQGIKVLLSGAGGDDIFSGYRRHIAILLSSKLKCLPLPIRNFMSQISNSISSGNVTGIKQLNTVRRIAKLFSYTNLNNDDEIRHMFQWGNSHTNNSLLSKDLTEYNCKNSLADFCANDSALSKMLSLEVRHFLGDHNLNYTDKSGMSNGVEVRVPFLDMDLVNFATTIPDNQKVKGLQAKIILKKAMEGILPNNVIYRPKTGFGAPIRSWLHTSKEPLIREALSESSIKKRGLFNYAAVQTTLAKDKNRIVDASYNLLAVACIEIWCRIFLDSDYSLI